MADRVVNDFSIRIATPNGTGSTSANDIILRSLFHMGLAASAKNLFPSNIAGLPTWYQIRLSPQGYQARREHWEVLIPLNPATLSADLDETKPGSVVIHNSDHNLTEERLAPYTAYGVPFDTLARKNITNAKLRPKLRNMIYVGVLAELFQIPHDSVKAAISSVFQRKQKVVDLNWEVCQMGIDYIRENFEKTDPYVLEPADQTRGKIIVDGNQGAALGAVFGGCTVAAWYPITPASSLTESLMPYLEKLRTTEDGKKQFVVVQAEDELAAVGMAIGAGWAGARSMTGTSGPGISLMAENMGLGYYAEVPTVIYDVARVGPSTGLPTRTQQSDILTVAFLSHGDTRFPMLFPGTPKEAFDLSCQAFDAADQLQTPIVFMSDLDLGMNTWVTDEFEYPEEPMNRGKVLSQEKLESLSDWGRYLDLDGDGIPMRSVAGKVEDNRAAYFTRGSGHDEYARYTESSDVYVKNLDRIRKKIDQAPRFMAGPVISGSDEAPLGVVYFGSTLPVMDEARDHDDYKDLAYLRLRAWPFHEEVREWLAARERVLVVEQNQQGQMAQLLKMDFPEMAAKLSSGCYYGGLPISAAFIRNAIDQFATPTQ